jgi:hypothetical protein
MKLNPRQAQLVERMAPGVLCAEGFLGPDPRPLDEILADDARAVEAFGLTHEQIADKLDEIIESAQAAFGNPVRVGPQLSAIAREAMGPIPCPWGGCGVFAKGDVTLKDESNGKTLRLTALSAHLVREHGFYQGRQTAYRLEPAELAELLDLA